MGVVGSSEFGIFGSIYEGREKRNYMVYICGRIETVGCQGTGNSDICLVHDKKVDRDHLLRCKRKDI
jgi:hypothetical protein